MSTRAGDRRRGQQPTMDDVAAAAGVSRALVSLVMRDSPRASAQARTAVMEAAARLGYRRNLAASNLAARRTLTIGLLLDDLHNPWFADVADGIQTAAEREGYQVILANGRRSSAVESRAVDTFLASRVDGIIVAGSRLTMPRLTAVGAEVPVVAVGRTLTGPQLGSVCADDAVGAQLAVQHLASLGHRRIAHIDGGRGAGAGPRRAGYVAAMRAAGLEREVEIITGDFTEEAGRRSAQQLLARRNLPTAIFTANDLSAVGVIDALDAAGISVPGNVSVVGYDNTAFAALHHISLTTIDQPRQQMGRLAATMMLATLQGTGSLSHVMLQPQLIVRTSTGVTHA
jgi:DNA-binding LacI/PurR family transcriptional regulator